MNKREKFSMIRLRKSVQVTPAFGYSDNRGWIPFLEQQKIHQKPSAASVAVIEGVYPHHVIVGYGRAKNRMLNFQMGFQPVAENFHFIDDMHGIGVSVDSSIRLKHMIRQSLVLAGVAGFLTF